MGELRFHDDINDVIGDLVVQTESMTVFMNSNEPSVALLGCAGGSAGAGRHARTVASKTELGEVEIRLCLREDICAYNP
jgi:hypothetical protein